MRHQNSLVLALVVSVVMALFALPALAAENVLKLEAPLNVYAHLYQPFPGENGDEIVLHARFKHTASVGSSWAPAIAMYWDPTSFANYGLQDDGRIRGTAQNFLGGGWWDRGLETRTWTEIKMVLTKWNLEVFARNDGGEWMAVKAVERPLGLTAAPAEIMIGKGYGSVDNPTYPAGHLDNSHTAPGAVGLSYIDDLIVTVDGKVVLHETFDSLGAWQLHVDPLYADQVVINTVPQAEADAASEGEGQ